MEVPRLWAGGSCSSFLYENIQAGTPTRSNFAKSVRWPRFRPTDEAHEFP